MDAAPRGIKRKRNADDVDLNIRAMLHHGLKEVYKATKKAKFFEVRKLIKRLKLSGLERTDNSELEDLKAQLLVLKNLNVEMVGNTAFKSKIRKRKQLYSNEQVRVAIKEEIGRNVLALAQPGSPAYKAQSKLLSSKSLADQVTSAVQAMQLRVCPQEKEQTIRPTEDQGGYLGVAHSESESEGDENSLATKTNHENDNIDEIDEEWESGTIEEMDAALSVDEYEIHGNEPSVAMKLSQMHSTFLPSLAVGFIPGNDDDPKWEAEAKIVDVEKKKNRRGQRARQAIWEKKYGRNANHKKKELEQRKLGKQRVKKHIDSKRQKNHNERVKCPETKADVEKGPKLAEPPRSRADERPLHPSWEAKKLLKEQTNPSIVPSQGKKIVF